MAFKKSIFLVCISVFLAGCGEADMQGIILDVNENDIKLATELSIDEYEDIKDESVKDIQNQDVHGDASYGLIDVTYDDISESDFNQGDEVEVWIDGPVLESYPARATAERIAIR